MKAFASGAIIWGLISTGTLAQDAGMLACGEQWQAAKATGTTHGATWPKFLAECRSGLAAGATRAPAPTPLPTPFPTPVSPATKPRADPSDRPAVVAGNLVFPAAISEKFSDLRPAQARQKTCSAQYQANKHTGGNGGLNWREKGGGYWSLCNQKLKGA